MAIMRKWTGRIRTADRDEYVRYIEDTGLHDYGSTPGNLGYEMLVRDLPDGSSEVTTTSWWQDLVSIAAFAGENIDLARYYPEDDRYRALVGSTVRTPLFDVEVPVVAHRLAERDTGSERKRSSLSRSASWARRRSVMSVTIASAPS